MNTIIEELRKNAEPVHPKCLGLDFTAEEKPFVTASRCSRIDPLPVFEIIDEETGQIDSEVPPTFTSDDPACRCKAYAVPNSWWRRGACPLATHFNPHFAEQREKVRAGQQKQVKK